MNLSERIAEHLASNPGLTDKELSLIFNKNVAHVNQCCRILESKGYIIRKHNPDKMNGICNYLTGIDIPNVTLPEDNVKMYMPVTIENIEAVDRAVYESANYGKENLIIHDVLNAYPANTDLNTVAMKVAVIDLTNSTNISRYKSKISLYDIAEMIVSIPNFDERVASGDPKLVNIIANTGRINLFSFASKYCTYHNTEIYDNDDYSIFDGVVRNTLPHYIKGLKLSEIDKWRLNYDYKSYNDCIGDFLDSCNIHIKLRRRKFDHFLWYENR